MTERAPIAPGGAEAEGGHLHGKALFFAKWSIYAADLVLLYLIVSIHLDLGRAEVFIKFALLFVVAWGPSILINRLETGTYLRP